MHTQSAPPPSLSALRHALLVFCLLVLTAGCKQGEQGTAGNKGDGAESEAVTFCHGSVTDILPRIAMEQGYFAEEGLTVTLKDMSDGKLAFDGLLKGECDFAVCGSPPIVLHDQLQDPNYTILATVMSDDNAARIIARRDRGISQPLDLKGKRIGVKRGIIGHLFLDLFMTKHGLAASEVIQVDMEAKGFQPALVNGEIDGFAMTSKMIDSAAKTLGDKAVVFAEPGLNFIYGILTTRTDVPRDLAVAPRVLKALLRAEEYAGKEPAAAKALLTKSYGFSDDEIEDIWARTIIKVSLANTLFVNLEDQYKWQVERGFAPAAATPPNYLSIVSPGYLREIKPEAVSVVKP